MPQINVKVIARASRCEIIPFNDGLKVKLTRPAVEGKANEQLCALLADYWHVPKKMYASFLANIAPSNVSNGLSKSKILY